MSDQSKIFQNNLERVRRHKLGRRFKGERHIVITTFKTGAVRAEFCGPGTNVKERIKLGIQPVNKTDSVCRTHDLDYTRITDSNKSKEYKGNEVRKADIKMVNSLKRVSGITSTIASAAIKAKMKAEDAGLLENTRFVSF